MTQPKAKIEEVAPEVELTAEEKAILANPFHPYANGREKFKAENEKYLNEKVPLQLIKDNENYKGDVTVGINGIVWQIQRGVPLLLPRKVAIVLAQAQHQESIAALRVEAADNVNLGDR
jgi:hypothetical protein